MTDQAPRRRIKPPGPFAVVAASSGVFFGLLGAFAIQERLASPEAVAQPVAAKPPQVLIRRVIVTRVVTDGRRPRASAPATTTSSPPPPAAAPAPAPLTTRTS
jgi:hypothetical protein